MLSNVGCENGNGTLGHWDTGTRRDLVGGAQDSDQSCNFVYIHRAQ